MKIFGKKKETVKSPNTPGSPPSSFSRSPSSGGLKQGLSTNLFASATQATVNEADSVAKLIHPGALYDDKPNTTNFPLIVPNDPFLSDGRIFNEQDFMGSFKRKASAKTNIKIDKGVKIDREGWLVKEGRVVKNWK
jgi:hypothetical protein